MFNPFSNHFLNRRLFYLPSNRRSLHEIKAKDICF